ncbi:MAG: formylglycine-generating enzyme family protein [Nitrospina sp.]|jgi:formylglycine-generating enzyme required for sulfatase activity|nr:formylglycine-generating enzyme family protein [Nitrospina sp.]MBT5632768.1 formylglycine-generating enzyme family protein [Nitrospina sp.]
MRVKSGYILKSIYFFAFILIGVIGNPSACFAFEKLGALRKECQTTCHQPEHILKAKKNRFTQPECKTCHTGIVDNKVPSPFSALGPTGLLNQNSLLLKSIIQANPGSSSRVILQQDKPSMAEVPAGEFVMGSNERWDDEAPEHVSSTQVFYIDLNEITNADYFKFVTTTQRTPPYHWPEGSIPKGKENHPVVYVSWFDANEYCSWAGKRLPTEQEWEKAARGEEGLIYPWGNEWSLDKSNNPYKHSTGTEPVGSYPEGRSPYGLYDLSGNVWEWVDSYYLPHPGNPVTRAEYGKDKRVLKGGSWFDCLSYGCGLSAPTFNRSFFTPEVKNNSFGFRCAKTKSP